MITNPLTFTAALLSPSNQASFSMFWLFWLVGCWTKSSFKSRFVQVTLRLQVNWQSSRNLPVLLPWWGDTQKSPRVHLWVSRREAQKSQRAKWRNNKRLSELAATAFENIPCVRAPGNEEVRKRRRDGRRGGVKRSEGWGGGSEYVASAVWGQAAKHDSTKTSPTIC